MKKFIHIFLFILTLSSSYGQTDTIFWFAAPEVTNQHSDRPVYARLSSGNNSTIITISIPANPSFIPIIDTIPPNTQRSYDLTPNLDLLENEPNTINNKGLLIEANKPISAIYDVLGTGIIYGTGEIDAVNTDIFVLKGRNALGTDFYIPFQTHYENYYGQPINAFSSFDIVATEDSTVVEVDLPIAAFGSLSKSRTIVLDKGQTFSFRTRSATKDFKLAGARVTSNKSIAITHKDDSVYINPAWDLLGDQIVPIRNIGETYVFIRSSGAFNIDRATILGTEDLTEVKFNGVVVSTINEGETYDFLMTEDIYLVETSAPVYALHLTGVEYEAGQALLPAIGDCGGSDQVTFFRRPNAEFRLNIVTKSGAEDDFEVNGLTTIVQPTDFSIIPNTSGEWVYASIVYDTTTIQEDSLYLITNAEEKFHLGVMYGKLPGSFSYGYFSSFSSPLELGENDTICANDSIELSAYDDKDSYIWNTGETTSSIFASDSGKYSVTTQRDDCTLKDSIYIFNYPPVHEPLLVDSLSYCADSLVVISTDTGFVEFMWSDGSSSSLFTPPSSGTYYLDVETINGCTNNDSVFVEIYALPSPTILYETNKDIYCNDSIVTLEVLESFPEYLWGNGETTQQITVPNTYAYSLQVVDTNDCVTDTSIVIDCSLFIGLPPNVFTPNGDGINDYFVIDEIQKFADSWTLTVTNRYGKTVYLNESYDNSWDGSNVSDGTYYYLLKHNELDEYYKGWVQVIK